MVQLASRKHLIMLSSSPAARRSVKIRETLDANRQRETKWTTDAELGLLMELWGRMARREPRTFDFAFRSHETSETVDLNFTKEAVKWKLKQLAQKGPEGGALRVPGTHASRRSGRHVSHRGAVIPAAAGRLLENCGHFLLLTKDQLF